MFQKLMNYYYKTKLNQTEMKIKEAENKIKYEQSSLGYVDDLAKSGFYSYSGFSASAYHAEKGEVEINISKIKGYLNSLEIKKNTLINKLNLTK